MPALLPAEIAGPSVLPLLGRFRAMVRFGRDTVGEARQLFRRYGKLVTIAAGGGTRIYSPFPDCPGTVLTYGPEAVREVATQHGVYHKVQLSGRLYPLGEVNSRREPLKRYAAGLFGVNGNEHRRHRRLMQPAFSKARLAAYYDDMVRLTVETIDAWKAGEPREVSRDMHTLTRRIVTKTLFGEDTGQDDGGAGQLLQDSIRLLANPLTRLLPYDWPGMPYCKFLTVAAELDQEMRAIIARKREQNRDDGDVLSILMKARDEVDGSGLTEDELIGHTGVLFTAGHETSANALNWTLLLLSQHPQIHADVQQEVRDVLRGEPPTLEQLEQLPLLTWVIKESMRLLPPAPWNARVASCDSTLLGQEIPRGTEVFVSILETHHMENLYPSPAQFDPLRWEHIDPSPYEYNPFSAGPRMCIGAGFAMQEIQIVLAVLLGRFRVEFVPDRRIDRLGNIVMVPKHGLRMAMCPLDGHYERGVGTVRGNIRELVELP